MRISSERCQPQCSDRSCIRDRFACPPNASFIDRSVAREFTDRLAERAKALKVGDPYDPATQIGPLVNRAALERIIALVDDAVARGAEMVTGGRVRGDCLEPTVLAGVTRDMRIYSEESFGPVVAIITVSGVEEAVRVANDSEYGLAAAVFSRNIDEAWTVARQLQTGICHINDATIHDEPHMPFGGVKNSGWGRFGGEAGLDEFTELRWITTQETPRQYPI